MHVVVAVEEGAEEGAEWDAEEVLKGFSLWTFWPSVSNKWLQTNHVWPV